MPRFRYLLTILLSAMVLAQSKPPSLINNALRSNGAVPTGLSRPSPAIQGKIVESYGKLPLSFEANQGQADPRVKFLSRTGGYTLFLTGDEGQIQSAESKLQPKFYLCSLIGSRQEGSS